MEHSNAEKSHSSDNESVSLSEEDTSVVKQLKAKKSKTKEGDKIKKKKVGRLF